MQGNLLVTPEKLESTATAFESEGTKVRTITSNMTSIVNGLKTVWMGEASTQYATKFNALQDDMNRMDAMIKEHVRDLREMATNYKAAESSNTEKANALANDILG